MATVNNKKKKVKDKPTVFGPERPFSSLFSLEKKRSHIQYLTATGSTNMEQ